MVSDASSLIVRQSNHPIGTIKQTQVTRRFASKNNYRQVSMHSAWTIHEHAVSSADSQQAGSRLEG
jgi:hypothetical protein